MISRRQFLRLLGAIGTAGVAAASYAFFFEPLFRLRVVRYDLQPKRWPAGLNLTIAALADLHACRPWMTPERIRSIVEITNGLGADLVVLLGDYVNGMDLRYVTREVEPNDWARELAALTAPLGVHAILGNHEWWEEPAIRKGGDCTPLARQAMEAVGIPVYDNDAVRLSKDGRSFWLAGLGSQVAYEPWSHLRADGRIGADDLDGALAKVTDDAPVILLAHEPDIAAKVPDRVSLLMSGHTHGGQIRLFGWAPVVPSRYGSRYAYGHIRERCDVVVSGGLGCTGLPIRIGVPPEIVLVRLGGSTAS
jgi:predicted MPP superfamily phosphohydrolase